MISLFERGRREKLEREKGKFEFDTKKKKKKTPQIKKIIDVLVFIENSYIECFHFLRGVGKFLFWGGGNRKGRRESSSSTPK